MKKKIIKIIAVILMAAFIAQDIVSAFPKTHQSAPSRSSLQIPSMFQDVRLDRYERALEARIKYVLASISYSKDFNYRLTLPMDAEGIRVDLNFDRQYPEGENTILPCALYKSTSRRLYEAVISPDESIQLRENGGKKDAAEFSEGSKEKFIAAPSTVEKRDSSFPKEHPLNPESGVKFHSTPLYNLSSILKDGLRRPKEDGVIPRYSAYNFPANVISLYDPYNPEVENLKNILWDGPPQERRRSCQYLAFDVSGIVIIIAKEIKARIPKLSSAEDAGFYDETFCMEDIPPGKIKGLIVSERMINNPIKELWKANMIEYYLPNIKLVLSGLPSILKIPSDKKETITSLIENQEFEEAAKLIFAAFAEQLKEELKIFDRDVLIKDYLLFLAKKYNLPVYNREGEKIFESDSLITLADGSQKPPIELKEGEKVLSLNEETTQPTKAMSRPDGIDGSGVDPSLRSGSIPPNGGIDFDRKLTRLIVQLGALRGNEQKNNFSNKLILLSKILRGINECFGKGQPDLAAQIVAEAIKNHIPGITSKMVTSWINECFEKGRPDSAAQIAVEAIKNHIPGITSKMVTRGINECFEKYQPASAAQIAVEAIKNHIPDVTFEIVMSWINKCSRQDRPDSAAQIVAEAIKNHIPGITSKMVTRGINECFEKGWPASAAQIVVEAIKNHIPGITSKMVTRGINECFEKGRPDSAAQIAVEAIKNHIPDVTFEIVMSWINKCSRQGRPDSAAQIVVEAIKNHIPGTTLEMVTRGINECFEKGRLNLAAQIAGEAIKNHIPGITFEIVTRGINECFEKGWPDSAAQIVVAAIKNHIPGITSEIVMNWINKCFGNGRPDLAAQIAVEAEKGIPVTKGAEKVMAILQELAGDFSAKTNNNFLYLITGYALQNHLLPGLPVSSRGIRENAFIIPMIEKIISIEGEGITINEILRKGGMEGLVKLYHETYDCIFSDILPEGLDLDNPRVSALLKTITHFDTSKFSRRALSFSELYRQFSEDYGQGKIKPMPSNLPPMRSIDVHTRRAQVLSSDARKYYQALMDAVKAALSAIDSVRQAKGAEEGSEYVYKDTIQTVSGIIDEEIKSLKKRENIVSDKARPFLNKRVDLLKGLKQKLSGAIGRKGAPLLAVSKDEFRELARLQGAHLLIRTMLFIHAFLDNPNWQGHFRNPIAREPDLANTARFIEFVESFIKPHLLDEAAADVKRLILNEVNARVFKDENEHLIGQKDSFIRRINIRPTRGWLAEFIGYFSDECWTKTINIMRDNPDAIALVFEDSDSKELLGGTLLMPNSAGGRKVLIDRGLSPRTEVTSGLDVEDFVEQVADFEEEIAAALGAEIIVVPLRSLEPGLGSNNPDIIQYYEGTIGTSPVIHLDMPNDFNNHDISDKCVVLREVNVRRKDEARPAEAEIPQFPDANKNSFDSIGPSLFRTTASPSSVDFLRDIVNANELGRNIAECMLSYIFSNKRLVLAFDDNLTGLKKQRVRQIIQAVEAWKQTTANKSDTMRRLLTNNLTILQYSSLDKLREKLGPDLDDNKRNIIFAFTARIEDEAHNPANMGRAVRTVLMEGEEKFTEEDYYPLVEVVTLALAKELSGWDRQALLSNLAKLNIDYRKLGISDIGEDNRGMIIFRLLPVMKRYDSNERVDRYARLLQFLRSA